MTDSNQIRINELARELEVKAKAIIDYLPEAGVTEKKTHSSSIEVEAAVRVREHFRALANAEAEAEQKAIAEKSAKEAAARAARMKPAVVAAPPPPPAPPHTPPAPAVTPPPHTPVVAEPVLPWKQSQWRQLQLSPLLRLQLFRSPLLSRLLSQQRFLLRQVRL
jgi:translation initiation factor IF-2